MNYILAHWRGAQSIGIVIWVNFVALTLLISALELFILSRLSLNPTVLIKIIFISLFITRLIIYPWQLVGLFRSAENDFKKNCNRLKTNTIQIFGLLSIAFTLVYSLQIIQSAMAYKQLLTVYAKPDAVNIYHLKLNTEKTQLSIKGDIAAGITNAVSALLKNNSSIRSIALHSQGGQIYEGRGLAKLFIRHNVDTWVSTECSSACAIAFIGGRKRSASVKAKLGFHQYNINANYLQPFIGFYNITAEQQRDKQLFLSRGVKPAFVDKMFNAPVKDIWFPSEAELIESGVITSENSVNLNLKSL